MPLDLSIFQNRYKNLLLEVSRNSKINLSLLTTETKEETFTIRVKDTELFFQVIQTSLEMLEYRFTSLEPGFPISRDDKINISNLCYIYAFWLDGVVSKYLEFANSPDLWAELDNIQPMLSSGKFTQEDFEMFTENEKKDIQDALSEFSRLVKEEISPIKENIDAMQVKLDYLSSAVNKLNRFDWKGVAFSTVIGIGTNLAVDTTTVGHIMSLFQRAFSSVIKLLPA